MISPSLVYDAMEVLDIMTEYDEHLGAPFVLFGQECLPRQILSHSLHYDLVANNAEYVKKIY